MNLNEILNKKILLLDGAMGSAIQALRLSEEAFGGHAGCNEYLTISRPGAIAAIHDSYLEAGADIIETNTFGANAPALGEYGLAGGIKELNLTAARLARSCADKYSSPDRPRFVAGSVGPGTKLPSLGQINFYELLDGYRRQCDGLIEGGADMIIIETVQDLLQAKAAVIAAKESMDAAGKRLPIFVSVTVERTGALLTGSDVSAVIATLEPLGIDALGLNCATGPAAMRPHLEAIARRWTKTIGLYPNAGLPILGENGAVYPETPEEFAGAISAFVGQLPIGIVGGCCGTTGAHIKELAKVVEGLKPSENSAVSVNSLSSLFNGVDARQTPPPLYIGERANATGGKAFRDALLADDYDKAFVILVEQEEQGSHTADLSVAYAGRDEMRDMEEMVSRAARECRLPLCLDSNQPDVIEKALSLYPGRAIVNSINLEDGGKKAARLLPVVKKFGAAIVCLTIDETGMALTADRKVEVARRLVDLCVNGYGLNQSDLFIDALTFTIGSGDPSLKDAAAETIKAIKRIKEDFPDVNTLLGVSNVSFGLSPKSRQALNSVFLDLCLKAGLDAAILNPKQIVELPNLDAGDVSVSTDLIFNRRRSGNDPLETFIAHFDSRTQNDETKDVEGAKKTAEESAFEGIVKGRPEQSIASLSALLSEKTAEEILNDILVPAMKYVGDLFGSGKLQLPFVLKSAEAMKKSVDALRPHFKAGGSAKAKRKLVIATVRGDVHDIGKNLVGIIVGNNGFEVIDLGTKVPVETIIEAVKTRKPDAVGMSGLLVSSAMAMADNLKTMRDEGFDVPVLVGGAALTPEYSAETLSSSYGAGKVVYCADAFAGLSAMRKIEEGEPLEGAQKAFHRVLPKDSFIVQAAEIIRVEAPKPPFYGSRIIEDVNMKEIYPLINEVALYRGRWGYRRGAMTAEEYSALIETEVKPKYETLKKTAAEDGLFKPKIAYGWFKCRSEGDAVIVSGEGAETKFVFPRRRLDPRVCIADFFRSDEDVAGFFIVTLGGEIERRGKASLARDAYLDYYLLHGLAVEAADALAEYCHEMMRRELGIGEEKRLDWQGLVTQKYRGGRYGFGYPACPDLSANGLVAELAGAERIGVTLTESWQMVPEFSTSAIVAHHPQAKYFAV